MSERDNPDDPVSPEDPFAHLFRPDDSPPEPEHAPAATSQPAVSDLDVWEPLVAVPTANVQDPPLPPAAEEAVVEEIVLEDDGPAELEVEEPAAGPVPSDPKEGRLFRSRGAPEVPEAVTAVGSMQARRLRTMARADEPAPAAEIVEEVAVAAEVEVAAPAAMPVASSGEPAPALQVMSRPPAPPSAPERSERAARDDRDERRDRGSSSGNLTGLGVYAITIGVTVILAFGETLFFGGEPGVITGIGLLAVSVFAAFAVRTRDAINAVFAPPIAFFIAAITAGQMDINANDLSGRLVALFFLLGGNWVWIVGSAAAALVIVALRRRFS